VPTLRSRGRTIWAPAILHAVAQGAVKLVDMSGEANLLPLSWIGACAALPYLAFVWPGRRRKTAPLAFEPHEGR
jgi:hypothetical protein